MWRVTAVFVWLCAALSCGCPKPTPDDGATGLVDDGRPRPEADIVWARFENASGIAADDPVPAALRWELAERLTYARGLNFIHPLEGGGATPELLPDTDAIVSGRWLGGPEERVELSLTTPKGDVLLSKNVRRSELRDAARELARALGLVLADPARRIPVPTDPRGLGRVLDLIEQDLGSEQPPSQAELADLPQDAWGLTLLGFVSIYGDDPPAADAALQRAIQQSPDLLFARYAQTLGDMPEARRLAVLRGLVESNPRFSLYAESLSDWVIQAIHTRVESVDPLRLIARNVTPDAATRARLAEVGPLWGLVADLDMDPEKRATTLFTVAAAELVDEDWNAAERHLLEARALGGGRFRDLIADLSIIARQGGGVQALSVTPIGLYEVRDYPPDVRAPASNERDCTGATSLIMAAERGDAALVTALLANGADPFARNVRGQSALHRAAQLGHVEVVKALLAASDPSSRSFEAIDDRARTPLHVACEAGHAEVVSQLLAAGARFDLPDRTPLTPLTTAVKRGHGAVFDTLVAAGAKVESRLVGIAARARNPDMLPKVVKLLSETERPQALTAALRQALSDDAPVALLRLVGVGARIPDKDIMQAAIEADAARVVAALLPSSKSAEAGDEPESPRPGMMPPLELALSRPEPNRDIVKLLAKSEDAAAWAFLGDLDRLRAALQADRELARRLGAGGLGAIHHAVRAGQLGAVKLLLDFGCPVELRTATAIPYADQVEGWTPLHFALAGQQIDIAKLLVKHGARPGAVDARGRPAAFFAQLRWNDPEDFIGVIGKDPVVISEHYIESMPSAYEEKNFLLERIRSPDALGQTGPEDAPVGKARNEHGGGVAESSGYSFGGRAIQLPLRIDDTSILSRRDVDRDDDADTGEAGLEEVLLRCYRSSAWPEAHRVASDLVAARELNVATAAVRAVALQNLAVTEVRLDDFVHASAHFAQAFALIVEVRDSAAVTAVRAAILENRSEIAWRSERFEEAVTDLTAAIALREEHDQEAKLLPVPWLILGTVYGEWGRYRDAVDAVRKGLSFSEASWGKTHPVTAVARNNLAALLDTLGDHAAAKEIVLAQVAAFEAEPDGADPIHWAVAEANAALFLMRDGALLLARVLALSAVKRLEAADDQHYLLGRLMLVAADSVLESNPEAAESMYRAAIIRLGKSYGERTGVVAGGLRRLAFAIGQRDPDEGRSTLIEAWIIASQADSPEERWPIEVELGRVAAHEGRLAAAIFFGKQAVATLEGIRAAARGVGATLEKKLVESRIRVWHLLADWLVMDGRLEEATRVLGLLKDDEVSSLATRGRGREGATSGAADVPVTPTENKVRSALVLEAQELTRAGQDLTELTKIQRTRALDAAEQERQRQATDARREAKKKFRNFLNEIEAQLSRVSAKRAAEIGAMNLRETSSLQGTLAELGHGAVLVHYLALEDKLRIVVTTPKGQVGRVADIGARDLNALVFRFRQALGDPRSDPRPIGEELHKILITPIEADLREAKAETLMVALDGVLRYIPLAALWDGEHWLVERYRVAIFSRAGLDKLAAKPARGGRIAGFGVGRKVEGFAQLTEVPKELEGIVRRNDNDPDGVMPGVVWMDQEFSRARFTDILAQHEYASIHIASHFVFEPGTEVDSYLLLGDGSKLTLEDIDTDMRFDGIDLLSLSACNTALGNVGAAAADAEGREIEGFAELTQKLGAKGVLASLWPVADKSTGELMRALYAIREGQEALTKADALRQAQLRFIRNKEQLDAADLTPRGPRPLVESGDNKSEPDTQVPPPSPVLAPPVDRSHPYYWAPFVLIGNWL